MMSAAAMSKMIRAKKKEMQDKQEAIDMSNKHTDGTDIYVDKMKEEGEINSENIPHIESHDPVDPKEEMNEEHHEQSSPEDNTMSVELDNLRMKRKGRVAKIMSK
jgi:hypothetical protein